MGAALSLILLLAIPVGTSGGRLVDARTGAPIAGADVVIAGARGSARTDRDGRFDWPSDPTPPLTVIVVLADGRVARPVHLTTLDPDVRIVVETAVTDVVTVRGVAPDIDSAPGASTTLLTAADLMLRRPASLAQAIETIAGAGGISDGLGTPAIRGLARGRTLILIDGTRVSTERGAGPTAAFVDPAALAGVDVARGPGSVAYGSDAFGGVIAARTRRPDVSDPWRVRAAMTIGDGVPERRAEVEVSTGYSRGGALAAVRMRDAGDYVSPEGVVPHSGWRDAGVRLRWDHAQAAGHWSVGWQTDVMRDAGRPRSDSSSTVATSPVDDSHRLTVSYERPLLVGFQHVRMDALVGASEQQIEQDRLAAPGRPRRIDRSDSAARDLQARVTGARRLGRVRTQMGLDLHGRYGVTATDTALLFNTAGLLTSTSSTVSMESARRTVFGVFAQADTPLARRVRLATGIRGDVVRSVNRGGFFGGRAVGHEAIAGLGAVTVAPFDALSITAQVARGFRDPTVTDRFSRGPVGRGFFEGNPLLRPETSLQFDLHGRYGLGRLEVVAAYYHYRLTDLVERYPAGDDLFRIRNRGRARLTGGEVEARVGIGHGLAIDLAAQASRGRDPDSQAPLDDIAPAAMRLIVRHAAADRLSSYLLLSAVAAHGRAGPSEVPTPAYTRLDAGAHWRVAAAIEIHAALRNLLDERYYANAGPRWVSAPGRQGSVSAVVVF